MFLFQHTFWDSAFFSIIFKTHISHAYNPYYTLLWYLPLSFKKEKQHTFGHFKHSHENINTDFGT